VSGRPGFPSGHTSAAAAFWMGAWLLAPPAARPWIAVAGLLSVGIMGWARTWKRCHTWIQVVAGAMFGCTVSLLIV
jgi:membrane-associated phospholipid phosphatase